LADPDNVVLSDDDIEELSEQKDDGKFRRTRLALAVILLLLLLLFACSFGWFSWLTTGKGKLAFVERNVECLKCHTELIGELSRYTVHDPFLKQDCTACHTPHGRLVTETRMSGPVERWTQFRNSIEWLPLKWILYAAEGPIARMGGDSKGGAVVGTRQFERKGQVSTLVAPESELCWTCHGGLGPEKGMQYQHPPFEENRCTTCHNPHASDYRRLERAEEKVLCVTCHNVASDFARANMHPPFEQRECTACHKPHASEFRGILVLRQRDLCFTCHQAEAQLQSKAVQHQPFANDNCAPGCHMPHSSDYQRLLVKNQPPLCYDCHPGIAQDFLKVSHHPVGTVNLNCADCHSPHAADYQRLLVAEDNAMCYRCHTTAMGGSKAIKASYEGSKHQPQLCIRCHTPHGSNVAPLLLKTKPEICLQCHTTMEGKNKHVVRPGYNKYDRASSAITCTDECHDPHGTKFVTMLNAPYPQDQLCLSCHKGVGKWY
jgi:predicted CXXCH cytochrome family protein